MNKSTAVIVLAALVLASCRGGEHGYTPIHLNLNMDYQERFDAQEANPFFADNRSMRTPVPGTVARGLLREDTRFYAGVNEDGSYVDELPVPTTLELLERGQRRYDIFCTPCHGAAGDGDGIITAGGYGYTPAPTYHSDRLREVSDGYLYDVITNGVRTMPAYDFQIPVADRWAIIAYLRALQRSQYAAQSDVPLSIRSEIQQSAGQPAAAGAPPADTTAADTAAADTTAGEAGDLE